MKLKHWLLRDDVYSRLMPIQTLNRLLATHKRQPWQQLYLFGWRHSPGRLTIYDLDLPRRREMRWDEIIGYQEMDWWHHSHVSNCPVDYMQPYTTISKQTSEIVRLGYKELLVLLLRQGCMIPSKCLDEWLQDDSRKYCAPELRLFYAEN